ncbi:MAG: DNA double-strand break repair nuclease NurA [Chloroflexota bacterium]|nr:DNA double-strand break repair nuclease NurA [Chloroflexota bacterium]
MITSADTYKKLSKEITSRMIDDRSILDRLREEIRPLKNRTQRILPRTTTAVSLVGTDGGNSQLRFDPFLVQIVRVVDSSNNEYCLEVITPSTNIAQLAARQFAEHTALGDMMSYLGVSTLPQLSQMIRPAGTGGAASPTWVQAYRELIEWAVLFRVVRTKDFATDTLIVFDGLLRSKVFAGELFTRYRAGLEEAISKQARQGRKLYIVGLAKKSKVLTRYALAMALEGVLATDYPAFVEIDREIEERVYVSADYARGDDNIHPPGAINKYVGGKMFFVKFGARPRDPIWPVDIFLSQLADAQKIIGYLLADAINGFPVPLYPQCLQRAHENAALVDFDYDVLQDQIFEGLRTALVGEERILDVFRLRDADPAQSRYG